MALARYHGPWRRSVLTGIGYDYDTFAADLATLLDQLDLREVVLAGSVREPGR